MPKLKHNLPSYRLHKRSGQAVVTLNGKDHYLGLHGTTESRQAYERLIAEWLSNNHRSPGPPSTATSATDAPTINELFVAYWKFAQGYYVKNGKPTRETNNLREALQPLVQLYGSTLADDFGPLALKSVRQKMIETGWCRKVVNSQINRIRRMFKWGVENEMVRATVLHALQAVAPLKRGRCGVRESKGVKPVAEEAVEAVMDVVPSPIRAMIELQRLTGMRPGEVVIMRACDIDTTGKIWVYRPSTHKTEHHGREREIFFGPRAQEVVKPFLKRDLSAYLFSPAEAQAERIAARHQQRTTPLSCGNCPGTNRKKRPRKLPGERYTTQSYGVAIAWACKQAFPPPARLGKRSDETTAEWQARLTKRKRSTNL